ncbi:hypothetical protein IX51_08900 [uncultured archaeon]|nr:hypothetical protein IX51_08900 [uncultured archaeon]
MVEQIQVTQEERRNYIGTSLRRVEDKRLLTGNTNFVEDLRVADTVFVAILRSPYAHARLLKVDVSRVRKMEGVIEVATGDDALKYSQPLPPYAISKFPSEEYCLATKKVRYMGEPVAAVAAISPELAEDALELIDVEYEPLKPVVDPESAMSKDSPLVYDSFGTNVVGHNHGKWGDVEGAFKQADVVLKKRVGLQRYSSTPLESVSVIATYDDISGELTLKSNAQMPGHVMMTISKIFGIPSNSVHLIINDIGGGFGLKTRPWRQLSIATILAMKLPGMNVKYLEDRTEHLSSGGQTAGLMADIEVAAKKDGKILAFRFRDINNDGASLTYAGTYASMHATLISGCYKINNIEWDSYTVLTNECPSMPNRGVGKPGIVYIVERMIETVAQELKMDPAEIRFRNFIQPDEFPYVTPSGRIYDSGNYPAVLKKALEVSGYEEMKKERDRLKEQGRLVGIGITTYIHGASATAREIEGITINIDPRGTASVRSGSPDMGTSHSTAFVQIVSDIVGMKPDDIRVHPFDSYYSPWTPFSGTHANKFSGPDVEAAVMAAKLLRQKVVTNAAAMLKTGPEDIEVSESVAFSKTNPENKVTIQDIAKATYQNPYLVPGKIDPGLEVTWIGNNESAVKAFDATKEIETGATHQLVTGSGSPTGYMTYPNSAHVALIEVDRETGIISILKYFVVHDIGNVINPQIVQGQLHGGVAHGIGVALMEDFVYDEDGQLIASSFANYLKPTTMEIPNIVDDHVVTPSPRSSLGIKGIGEGETFGPLVTMCNAVEDALSEYGAKVSTLPLTPEKIRNLINRA